MSIASNLLAQVLSAAQAAGLDQARLAEMAGMAPETISRAKKRGTVDLRTIEALAKVVGLHLELAPDTRPADPAPIATNRSPLADPKWGLAWSNPNMDTGTLIRNALAKGGLILLAEAVKAHGLDEVSTQWRLVKPTLKPRTQEEVERRLQNFAKGISNAQARHRQTVGLSS